MFASKPGGEPYLDSPPDFDMTLNSYEISLKY